MAMMTRNLFELAMHDRQYRDYKSGVAKKRFEDDLQRAKDAAMAKNGYSEEEIKKLKRAKADPIIAPSKGQSALGGFRTKVRPLLRSSDASISMMRCSAIISTPWGEYEKILDRIYRTCGGSLCQARGCGQ